MEDIEKAEKILRVTQAYLGLLKEEVIHKRRN
jgi:hypothetical protein